MIGIVGGTGPYSGIDLFRKVLDNTLAGSDQEHLDIVMISMPSGIADRTEFLVGKGNENPGINIARVILRLEYNGATVAGIPCNTAHSDEIFKCMQQELQSAGSNIKVLNMIEETVAFIVSNYPDVTKVGVLSTTGSFKSGVYSSALQSKGFEVILPPLGMQETMIHPAIYHPVYGIKSTTNNIHPQARKNLLEGAAFLKGHGAQAVILGCTEIPLVIKETTVRHMISIDPTRVLARALIQYFAPDKLKPDNQELDKGKMLK